ncbi:MurR/RpiR family transcriptional regulator [Enterococcus sp. HY326]|uniref:MurR/RpiR family transcriptional regulator n=1 Tax=Enterococcus sp. HY326 TaxID=2971265 RepID=UPI0022406C81|nr:MurR/RpiR family transcriptional regulator [Enterococcus sp. HY326]
MYLFQKIEEDAVRHEDARKYIGDFLLLEKGNVSQYSMQQIAEKTFTSKTTLFRYAKNLGYSGWKEFLQDFLEEVHYTEHHYSKVDPNLPFMPKDTIPDIIEKITTIQTESLRETADQMDVASLKLAAERILQARRYIVLFGISPNNLLGAILKRKFASIGILMEVALTDESGTYASAMKEGDCGIILSYSGNNEEREPMRFVKALKEQKVNLIGITGGGKNFLREEIDCILTISSRERLYSKISNFTTEESIMHIFNLLYAVCFSKNFEESYQHKVVTSKKFENRRNASLINMQEGNFEESN